ncbi:bifunctional hydroxymethylpyrimidine kinase/phosphomethylpyrimidine kinase [Latilactobacillus fuchuensis]|uniref:pyridoxal kinase n=2 Tax=Latilactobacillus fuchuensis TaxID=164393 RepID=A0A2N9DWK4_9LACO|nr:bifunctional hydroxymethylpyrimidine kinase/phosphomethylpyrimidine kinase [Latilactobacillus fuchuensis]KRL60874.1 hypothetical protein FC69_GL001114 [Latilactobacillus fuchuensis DSM 14340 = JCM 11249]MCP8858007.1 bifunctional hydroxymethylpyrimidine kinase/phosphomethylpyrimidine kinase [Latilactobacillus fuchuensis]SPC39054.1 Hydroxymethylpyrimidine phosphate kinase ThiD [Latilactobacillus fuchuensis]
MTNILTIAGSDTLAGGGLQADLKTFEALGTFGLSVVTCLATVQANRQFTIDNIASETVLTQLDAVLAHVPITYVKIGLINDVATLKLIIARLATEPQLQLIIDPVLAFKEGTLTPSQSYLEILKTQLLPRALVVTPNLIEACQLSGLSQITNRTELEQAATIIRSLGPQNVVIKGGQRLPGQTALDLLQTSTSQTYFEGPRLNTSTVDGAGCTFSAAITAELAQGQSLEKAVKTAKDYVYQSLQNGIVLRHQLGNVWQVNHYQKRGCD